MATEAPKRTPAANKLPREDRNSELQERLNKLITDYQKISDNLNNIVEHVAQDSDQQSELSDEFKLSSQKHSLLESPFQKKPTNTSSEDQQLEASFDGLYNGDVTRLTDKDRVRFDYTVSDIAPTLREESRIKESGYNVKGSILKHSADDSQSVKQTQVKSILIPNEPYNDPSGFKNGGGENAVDTTSINRPFTFFGLKQATGGTLTNDFQIDTQEHNNAANKPKDPEPMVRFQVRELGEGNTFGVFQHPRSKSPNRGLEGLHAHMKMASRQTARNDKPADWEGMIGSLQKYKAKPLGQMSLYEISKHHATMQRKIERLFTNPK